MCGPRPAKCGTLAVIAGSPKDSTVDSSKSESAKAIVDVIVIGTQLFHERRGYLHCECKNIAIAEVWNKVIDEDPNESYHMDIDVFPISIIVTVDNVLAVELPYNALCTYVQHYRFVLKLLHKELLFSVFWCPSRTWNRWIDSPLFKKGPRLTAIAHQQVQKILNQRCSCNLKHLQQFSSKEIKLKQCLLVQSLSKAEGQKNFWWPWNNLHGTEFVVLAFCL